VPNRFELVLLAAHQAGAIAKGSHITVDPENDKNAVIVLPMAAATRALRLNPIQLLGGRVE
jgi:hypothetical protein